MLLNGVFFVAGFRLLHDMFQDIQGDRPDVENIAVLVTDRVPRGKEDAIKREADLAKAKGIRIITVGICDQVSFSILSESNYLAESFFDIIKSNV